MVFFMAFPLLAISCKDKTINNDSVVTKPTNPDASSTNKGTKDQKVFDICDLLTDTLVDCKISNIEHHFEDLHETLGTMWFYNLT